MTTYAIEQFIINNKEGVQTRPLFVCYEFAMILVASNIFLTAVTFF